MTIVAIVLALAMCLSMTMAAAWFIALHTNRSGWIDAIWSLATGMFGAVAAVSPSIGSGLSAHQVLLAAMALIWSLRLGMHISRRTARGGQDPRYEHLFEQWGARFRIRLFWFLQIQALAALVLVLSIMTAAHRPEPGISIFDGLGLLVFIIAVFGEAVADRQLSSFRHDPANLGKVCDKGLWGLSRHPNYFFEWLAWLAYPITAIDFTGGYPWGWLSFAAPLLMYWLLVHVSGIPPLEAHMLRSRKEAFQRYQRHVNAFWPGWPNGRHQS